MSLEHSTFATPAQRLTAFFDQRRATYEDSAIDEISLLLEQCGHVAHKCPRTYILFRVIGQLDAVERMVREGFSDQWFPVEHRTLPSFLAPSIKTAIVQRQGMILTKSLDLEHGRHRHFAPEEPLPFDILGPLGSGGYGQVDKILSKISFRHYALKRVRRRDAFGKNSKEAVKVFLNELKIAKSLEHKHFVRYVGSYTDKHHLGLVIAPVAEADLGTYMRHMCASTHTVRFDNTRPLPSSHLPSTPMEMCVSLRTYFGCLAAALTYLHSQSIRHKDIKPQNILVSKGNVLFSDFGLSRNFADDPGSTTSGLTPASPRYCAPEVAAYESRNTSSDVWSLGCVFLEMAAALQSINADRIKQYYMSHGSLVSYYHANPAATSKLISHWETSWDSRDKSMLGWVKWMLMTNRFERPTAAQVLELILDVETDEAVSSRFCGICCVPIADTDSCDSLADEFSYMAASQRPQTSDDGHRTTSTSHLMDNETKVPSLDRGRQIPQEQETRSMVSSRRNRMIAPGTNKHHLSIEPGGWMRNFKVFGVPLSISIQYAGIAAWVRNLLVPVDAEMKLKVPIVVEECCTFLVTRGQASPDCFDVRVHRDEPTVGELVSIFDSPPQLSSNKFAHFPPGTIDGSHVATVLQLYLESLPDRIMPTDIASELLRYDIPMPKRFSEDPSEADLMKAYISTLVRMPEPNRNLLLYLLVFLASFEPTSRETSRFLHLARIFEPLLLSFDQIGRGPLASPIVRFLMLNAIYIADAVEHERLAREP